MTDAGQSGRRYSWTQPCCGACWQRRNPAVDPVRLKWPDAETCVYCGASTTTGIYVRIDPSTAPHPTQKN